MDFLKQHFDRFLLSILFIVMVLMVLHLAHKMADPSVISWAREEAGTILGALLGLITGGLLRGGPNSSTTLTTATLPPEETPKKEVA